MKLPGYKQYPKSWIIGGFPWKLNYVRNFKFKCDRDSVGLCDPAKKEVVIKYGQGRKDLLKTFIHEIIHAFETEYDFELEHKHVYALEEAISDFLIDNL